MRALRVFLAAVAMAACGVSQTDITTGEVELGDDTAELSTTKDTFLIARRDVRRCIAPLCGGYWVKDLNSTMQERYVSALDFSGAGLTDHEREQAVGPDNETILYGRLGPKENTYDTRTLLVKEAYRALPGNELLATEKFYSVGRTKIACITTPCANLSVTRVNRTTGHAMATDLDVTPALKPFVDEAWVTERLLNGRAIAVGHIVRANRHVTLQASQVFLRVPDRVEQCPAVANTSCGAGKIRAWNRDDNRCLQRAGCTTPGVCAQFQPSCEPGYTLQSWVNVCPRHACDPDFVF